MIPRYQTMRLFKERALTNLSIYIMVLIIVLVKSILFSDSGIPTKLSPQLFSKFLALFDPIQFFLVLSGGFLAYALIAMLAHQLRKSETERLTSLELLHGEISSALLSVSSVSILLFFCVWATQPFMHAVGYILLWLVTLLLSYFLRARSESQM